MAHWIWLLPMKGRHMWSLSQDSFEIV